MIETQITVLDSTALATITALKGMDWRVPLKRFRRYIVKRLGYQIEASSAARGGSGRGISWRPMAPEYIRKGGTVIPAWGGAEKIRGQGTVKGRKKHGGGRIQGPDMRMYAGVLSAPGKLIRSDLGSTRLTMVLSRMPGLQYAEALRPFLRFQEPTDRQELEKDVLAYARGQIAEASKR